MNHLSLPAPGPRPASALCALVLLMLLAPLARAADGSAAHYDQIHLSVHAGGQVDTDLVTAVVYMEHQSTEQTRAASEVNQGIRWAAERAAAAGVKASPFRYRSSPVYSKKHIAGWRVHQSLRLESAEPGRIGGLLGELQRKLSIESLRHVLSPGARAQAEDEFLIEALGAFQQRAQLIARTLKRPGYRIVDLNINTGSAPIPLARTAMAVSGAQVPAPVVEGGQQRISIRISGTVELQPGP